MTRLQCRKSGGRGIRGLLHVCIERSRARELVGTESERLERLGRGHAIAGSLVETCGFTVEIITLVDS